MMTVVDAAVPEGWYPDPYGAHAFRKWDGDAWTSETRAPLASIPRRAVAHLLDWCVLAPICLAVYIPAMRGLFDDMRTQAETTGSVSTSDSLRLMRHHLAGLALATLVIWVISVLYDMLLTKWRGQTVGKMVCRVRVIDESAGTGLTWRQAAIRAGVPGVLSSIGSVTPVGSVLVGLDYLWPAWDVSRRTLHDRAASTIVVDLDARHMASASPPGYLTPSNNSITN